MTDEYKKLYNEYELKFSFSDFGINNIEKLRLISLICYLTQKLREKNKDIMVIDVIEKIIPDWKSYGIFLQNISLVCESLLNNAITMKFPYSPTFEYKTPKEVVDGIREIVNKYLPF